ncbi:MAG: DUF935 family protein [Pusillimonas sp.]
MTTKKTISSDLTIEVASIRDDILLFGGVLPNPDKVVAKRGHGKGLEIYEDLESDAHVGAVVAKRKRAVIAREWMVNEADDSDEAAAASELVRTCISKMSFDRVTENFLDAVMKGYAVGEVMWINDTELGIIRPAEIRSRNPQRFIFKVVDDGFELRLVTMNSPVDGIALPDRKFVVFTYDKRYENPYGNAVGNKVFWPVFFKRKGVTFWLTFCDKFGSPTSVGKYPVNATSSERKTLKEALECIANDYGVILPEGMDVTLLEATKTSTDTYEKLARFMDEQISEAVLGETGTTNQQSSEGSRAKDQVGNEVRLETAKSDSDALCECLNETLVKWIIELNMPGAPMPKLWRNFEQEKDLNTKADRDSKLTQMGVKFSKSYYQNAYNLKDDDFELIEMQTMSMLSEETANFAAPAAKVADAAQEAVDNFLGDMSPEELQAQMDGILAPIIKLINDGSSYEDIMSGLVETYDYLDTETLQNMLERAFFVTSVWGRLNGQK